MLLRDGSGRANLFWIAIRRFDRQGLRNVESAFHPFLTACRKPESIETVKEPCNETKPFKIGEGFTKAPHYDRKIYID